MIDQYQALGLGFIFATQVIGYTTEHRRACCESPMSVLILILPTHRIVCATLDEKLIKAIIKAVSKGSTQQVSLQPPAATATNAKKEKPIHEIREDLVVTFCTLVIKRFDTAENAFDTFKTQSNTLGRKSFKKLIASLGMQIGDDQRKQLRKQIAETKSITLDEFAAFVNKGGVGTQAVTAPSELPSSIAELPSEVPESKRICAYFCCLCVSIEAAIALLLSVPPTFKERKHAAEQLLLALVDATGGGSTSVTAPRSRVSSQGSKSCVVVLSF